jgi:hypothetical protein
MMPDGGDPCKGYTQLAARLRSPAPSEAEQIISAAERMAQRTGYKFTVDPEKLRDFPSEPAPRAQTAEGEAFSAYDLLQWLKAQPGASFIATIDDVEEAISVLSALPQSDFATQSAAIRKARWPGGEPRQSESVAETFTVTGPDVEPDAVNGPHHITTTEDKPRPLDTTCDAPWGDELRAAVWPELVPLKRAISKGDAPDPDGVRVSRKWLAMDSAPKDGTHVLVWWPHWYHAPFTAYYDTWGWQSEKVLSNNGDGPLAWQPISAPTAAEIDAILARTT